MSRREIAGAFGGLAVVAWLAALAAAATTAAADPSSQETAGPRGPKHPDIAAPQAAFRGHPPSFAYRFDCLLLYDRRFAIVKWP